jgi:hypothetical protein
MIDFPSLFASWFQHKNALESRARDFDPIKKQRNKKVLFKE